MYKDILYAVDRDIAQITINRPHVLNAFTPETLDEMQDALAAAGEDKSVGVVVITGAGERAFCAGGDINWESTAEFQSHEYELHNHIIDCPKPVIARVNGYAIGGGNHMAYVCDLTIAADHAIFGQNGPRVGSPAAGFTVAYAAAVLGQKRAREMWMTCRRYSAQHMMDWGLVNAVVPYAELDDEVRRFADGLLKASPSVLKLLKASFKEAVRPIVGLRQDDMGRKHIPGYFDTDEQQEGIRAFREKRAPDFRRFR
ncbi:enoyl-CoA hydratase-related protein [Pseudochelatococcus sp. B33]